MHPVHGPVHHQTTVVKYVAKIVAAYVTHNSIASADVPRLIANVHAAISATEQSAQAAPPVPAVDPKKSVKPDHLICLEDGKRFVSLKRHLRTQHGMTPAEYREKWNLPRDYSMTAADYSASRSKLARDLGIGRKPEVKPIKKRAAR